jgi:hypothetical protein
MLCIERIPSACTLRRPVRRGQLPPTAHASRRRLHSTRGYENSRNTEDQTEIQKPFNILFFGRDEFSCTVFKHLHAAPGKSTHNRVHYPYQDSRRTETPASDVWKQLHVATKSDEKVGRRRSQLSVCPSSVSAFFILPHASCSQLH